MDLHFLFNFSPDHLCGFFLSSPEHPTEELCLRTDLSLVLPPKLLLHSLFVSSHILLTYEGRNDSLEEFIFFKSLLLPHHNGRADGLNLSYKYFPNRISTKAKLITNRQIKTSTNPVKMVAIYQIEHLLNSKVKVTIHFQKMNIL